MKPRQFAYLKPATMDDAIAALADNEEAALLAGGQSLMAMLNMRIAAPSHLIDLSALEELRQIERDGDTLRLGAMVRHRELETSPEIASAAPMLAAAARRLAHPAIRNRGTIGGSLALADPAAELPACVLALGGRITVTGTEGIRQVAVEDFLRGSYETELAHADLLTAIDIPVQAPGELWGYEKLTRRSGDYALAGIALRARTENGRIAGIRIAVFGVGDRASLALAAASAIEGQSLGDDVIEAAAGRLAEDLKPTDQPDCSGATKLHLACVLLRRLLRGLR